MIKELTYEDVYKVTIETAKELMSKSFYYYNKTLPEVTPQSRLKEDLNIDSLDRIDFLLLVEDVYKVELIDEESKEEEKDFYGTQTIEEFSWYLHKKLTGGYGELRRY